MKRKIIGKKRRFWFYKIGIGKLEDMRVAGK